MLAAGRKHRPPGPPGQSAENAGPSPLRPGVWVQEGHERQGPRLGAEVRASHVHGGPRSRRQATQGRGARQPGSWESLEFPLQGPQRRGLAEEH